MNRHPASDSRMPPIAGPSARPSACALPCTPIARPSIDGGIASAISATLLACSIAAPIAWSTRAAIRIGSVGARPQSAEPTVNTAEPVHVEQLAPDRVGDPADRRDSRDQHQQVGKRDPFDRAQARVEIAAHPGQRDSHDARVELPHERADADGADDVPMRARALAHRDRPSGLAQQLPPHPPG